MIKKIILLVLLSLISTVSNFYAQCTGCTVPGPTTGNVTVNAGQTMCFTSNATLGDVTFGNNSKICVAPGVTVIIQNNVNSTSGNNVALEIGGTLQFNQVPTFNANLTANVQSGGILRSGTTGNNNFTFNGTTNTLTNNGTVQVSVLQFNNASSTNIIDNYKTLTIGSNINISGASTTFRNWDTITIGQSFNMNSTTTYINCGTINTATGFNAGGGRIINTGNFTVSTGSLNLANGSRFENYGILDSRGTTNNSGTTSVIYNEGLVKFNTYQGDGWLRGPSSSSKKGYFELANQLLINSGKVGPNLDFKRNSGGSSQATVFNASNPNYVTSTGTTTTQTGANVTFDCRAAANCSAPLVTNIGVCPNINGTFPPQANDDAYTIAPGSSATSNVLANDFAQYNGAAATTSNVTISQVSTTNSGVTVSSSGVVSVAAGTAVGTYTLVYKICSSTNSTSCDTATVTVTVPPDTDGDGYSDINDLDDDNDGILDDTELRCDYIPNVYPYTSGNGAKKYQLLIFDWSGATLTNVNDTFTTSKIVNGVTYTAKATVVEKINTPNTVTGTGSAVGNIINTWSGGGNQMFWRYANYGNTAADDLKGVLLFSLNNAVGNKLSIRFDITATKSGVNQIFDAIAFDGESTAPSEKGVYTTNASNWTLVDYLGGTPAPTEASISGNQLIYDDTQATQKSLFAYTRGTNISITGDYTYQGINARVQAMGVGVWLYCDTDNDGTPNYLDTDSDGDGCPDAVEGGDNITQTMLNGSNAIGSNIFGTLNSPAIATVDANGVPVITNTGSTFNVDGQAQGQTAGSSANASVNGCYCYKPAQTSGAILDTNHGITALGRAGADNSNWPMVRKGAWTVLEAKTKGFVVNRVANPATDIANPVEGMMVFDTTAQCLKIYNGTVWSCYSTPACP